MSGRHLSFTNTESCIPRWRVRTLIFLFSGSHLKLHMVLVGPTSNGQARVMARIDQLDERIDQLTQGDKEIEVVTIKGYIE